MDSSPDHVVLTGFMGTGKSTVGRLLAARLGRRFIDTDQAIEDRHGPIPRIFEDRGEPAFREIEAELAAELSEAPPAVIATGGGMLIDPETARTLGGRVFCLTAPVGEILHRVMADPDTVRPLLDAPDPAGRAADLLADRAEAYARFEQIETAGRTPEEVVSEIMRRLAGVHMKTIGLLGGMSWESSAEYYRIINEEVRRRLGGTHSAKSVMYSVDFHEVETMQDAGDWAAATKLMIDAARHIETAGADVLVICTNTMHRMADEVADAVGIPLLHIADATAAAIKEAGLGRVGLLGTRYTMEDDFYRGRLEAAHDLAVDVPDAANRAVVHNIIFDELVKGVINDVSRRRYLEIIGRLIEEGAEGIIAGCTEIELLVHPEHVPVPYFPTSRLHAEAAVTWALRGD